jgi:hypothetical protein
VVEGGDEREKERTKERGKERKMSYGKNGEALQPPLDLQQCRLASDRKLSPLRGDQGRMWEGTLLPVPFFVIEKNLRPSGVCGPLPRIESLDSRHHGNAGTMMPWYCREIVPCLPGCNGDAALVVPVGRRTGGTPSRTGSSALGKASDSCRWLVSVDEERYMFNFPH